MKKYLEQLDAIVDDPPELLDYHAIGQIVSAAARQAAMNGDGQWSKYIDPSLELSPTAARRLLAEMIAASRTARRLTFERRRMVAAMFGAPKPAVEPARNDGPLTVPQAAAKANLGKRTIYRLVKTGELPAVRVGRAIRVRPDDLEAYLSRPERVGGGLFG